MFSSQERNSSVDVRTRTVRKVLLLVVLIVLIIFRLRRKERRLSWMLRG